MCIHRMCVFLLCVVHHLNDDEDFEFRLAASVSETASNVKDDEGENDVLEWPAKEPKRQ